MVEMPTVSNCAVVKLIIAILLEGICEILMKNTPKVSIVIPAYNAEMFLANAVQSVLNQTLQNFELIIVDDSSMDNTIKIAEAIDDDRIVIKSQPNGGPSSARNCGIKASSGEYIAFLDADDIYSPRFLEKTIGFLDKRPECGVGTTNVFWTKKNGTRYIKYPKNGIVQGNEGVVKNYLQLRVVYRSFPQISALVLRRTLLDKCGMFDPDILVGEEEELMLRWLTYSRLAYVDEPLSYYNDTEASFIKNFKRNTHAKVVFWKKVIKNDDELKRVFPYYINYRNIRLFRTAMVTVAAGCIDDAKIVARIWPVSPLSIYWWVGYTFILCPRPVLRVFHSILKHTKAVKRRQGI